MAIKVQQEGVLSPPGRFPVKVGDAHISAECTKVRLAFCEERGFGESRYQLNIDGGSFTDLALAMMHADSESAIKAFGAALRAGIPEMLTQGRIWAPSMANANAREIGSGKELAG